MRDALWDRIERFLIGLLGVMAMLIGLVQVIGRYVAPRYAISWAEEVIVYLIVWGIMLAASADGASGATAKLLPQFEHVPDVTILFTGYVNPNTPAERLIKSGRAKTMRWNVHPRLGDTVTLVRDVQARTVIPAFCDRSQLRALAEALAPVRVTMDGPIAL